MSRLSRNLLLIALLLWVAPLSAQHHPRKPATSIGRRPAARTRRSRRSSFGRMGILATVPRSGGHRSAFLP